jgi:hypothetical protein
MGISCSRVCFQTRLDSVGVNAERKIWGEKRFESQLGKDLQRQRRHREDFAGPGRMTETLPVTASSAERSCLSSAKLYISRDGR